MADEAEIEASEVLHTLAEHIIENKNNIKKIKNQTDNNLVDVTTLIQWHTPVGDELDQKMDDSAELIIPDDLSSPEFQLNVELSDSDNQPLVPQNKKIKKTVIKKEKKLSKTDNDDNSLIKLEDSPEQVQERLNEGCECKEMCFEGLVAEHVYKHRLNIAELTKIEHDMYLMGVTMACLAKRNKTSLQKKRIRQRAAYVYQGEKVCLDAFLYLENVTRYHLKRIRNHVMTQGVIPRVHGNMGKIPHNTFPLDMYKTVEIFLKKYLKQFSKELTKNLVIYGKTRAQIYNSYKMQQELKPNEKIMGYSTFRHFMRKQFPNVRFAAKVENQKLSNNI